MLRISCFLFLIVLFTSCKLTNEELLDTAYTFQKEKKYDKAIETYNQVIKRTRKLQLPFYNRGIIYMELEKYNEALVDFNTVLSLQPDQNGIILVMNPNSPFASEKDRCQVPRLDVMYQIAQANYYMDSLRSALNGFQTLIANNYEEKSNCLLWAGTIMIRYGKKEKACEYFNSAKLAAITSEDITEADRIFNENCGK